MKPKRVPDPSRPFRRIWGLVQALAWLSAAAACAPVPSGPPTALQKDAFVDQAQGLMRTMRGCDEAARRASVGQDRINYEVALSAQAECARTANTLENFRFDVGRQFQQVLDDAMAACWRAYSDKARRLARQAMVINGAAQADQTSGDDHGADGDTRACKTDLMSKAKRLGFDTAGLAV